MCIRDRHIPGGQSRQCHLAVTSRQAGDGCNRCPQHNARRIGQRGRAAGVVTPEAAASRAQDVQHRIDIGGFAQGAGTHLDLALPKHRPHIGADDLAAFGAADFQRIGRVEQDLLHWQDLHAVSYTHLPAG